MAAERSSDLNVDPRKVVDEAIKHTGGLYGRFQILMFIIAQFTVFGVSWLMFAGPKLFTQEPKFECSSQDTWTACSRETACELDAEDYRIDYEHPETIRNIVTELDLVCASDYKLKVANVGGSMLFGALFSVVFLVPLADIYGRRPMLNVSTLICLIAYCMLYHALTVTKNFDQCLLSYGLFGLGKVLQLRLGYIAMTEFVPTD